MTQPTISFSAQPSASCTLEYCLSFIEGSLGSVLQVPVPPAQLQSLLGAIRLDSRLIEKGDVFVAFAGGQVDGHEFIEMAVERGAGLIVVHDQWRANPKVKDTISKCEVPVLETADQVALMAQLATAYRSAFAKVPFIAITGSVGKTTVKNCIGHILNKYSKTLVTSKSQNNHLGVPMTLSRLQPDIELGVAELGANHVGEINAGASLVKPCVSVLTCVNAAHIEGFGSLKQTAKAKSEIFDHLVAGGIAVLNRDDQFFEQWRDGLSEKTNWISFGLSDEADLQLLDNGSLVFHERLVQFGVPIRQIETPIHIKIPLLGRHNQFNAMIAITAIVALIVQTKPQWQGQFYDNIANVLSDAPTEPGRLAQSALNDYTQLIDDTWNATPDAVASSLMVLGEQTGPRWFVFGGMAELGEHCQAAHEQVGLLAAKVEVDQFWAYGTDAAFAAEVFAKNRHAPIACFQTHETMQAALLAAVLHEKPACVLVKGSRSRKMERQVQYLQSQI